MRIFFRNFFSKNLVNLYLTRCQRCLEYGKLLKTAFELKNRSYKKPTKNKKRVSTMKESNHRVPFPHPAALPLNHPTVSSHNSTSSVSHFLCSQATIRCVGNIASRPCNMCRFTKS
ncbi:Protein CBG26648 [Caenorhabditis briggsae]|uniref:Protein CBG26648 n=1 Tax=Caenorhabditis briggsae TaxID=6238 RepID=B6IE10_CAEBR|nr:Protein CBG26648 [Caenorhabditis briggsae]CAS01074.1 Protein CBG26648 [Caenorhabditis briggsae]